MNPMSVPNSETGQRSSPHIQLKLMRWQPQQGNADRVTVENNFDTTSVTWRVFRSNYTTLFASVQLSACLHAGGGPQLGEVTRLAVVEDWPAFTCKLTTPGSRGDVTRRCCLVARRINRENGGRTTHFGGQCSFPLIIWSHCNISVLWLFTFLIWRALARLQM